jgi:hypothetical protein
MKPQQYSVYKGMGGKFGALQLNLQLPHFYRGKEKDFTGEKALDKDGNLNKTGDWQQREGAVFLEMTSAVGPNKYDWEKKITFALSVSDMAKLISFFTTEKDCSIMHDPGAKTDKQGTVKKFLNLKSPGGVSEAGCMVQLTESEGTDKTTHTVPLTPDECVAVRCLLQGGISRALGWI